MKSIVVSKVGFVSMVLLILPGEVSLDRPFPTPEYLLAQRCRVGRTANPRGPEDALIPYVISPRNTAVLSDRPSLHWNPIAGVDRYTVSVRNGDSVIWTKEVNTNIITYPAEMDALESGIDYTLVIEAANGRSSTEEDTELSFHLLPSTRAEVVRQAQSLFASQATTEEAALLQADFYTGSELYSEAIDTLKILIETTQSPTIHRQLGDLYARSSLYLWAEPRYLSAVSLAEEDLEEQARAQAALGELYVAIELNQEAVRWFTQAMESYKELDNQFKVRELQERVANLSF